MSRWLRDLVSSFKFQWWLGFVCSGGGGALWFGFWVLFRCLVSFSLGIRFCLDLGLGLNQQLWWWVMRLGCLTMGGGGGLFGFWVWILAFVWV